MSSGHFLPGLVDTGRTHSLRILCAPRLAVEGSRHNLHAVKLLLSAPRRDLPMLENVVVEDCTPKQDPLVTTGAGNAASERGCGLKGGELRVDELLHVALAVTRPEHIRRIYHHVVREHNQSLAKEIHLPIRRTTERQVHLEFPRAFELSLRVV